MLVNGRKIAKEIMEEVRGMAGEQKSVCFLASSRESESYIKIKGRIAGELGIKADVKKFDMSLLTELTKGYDGVVIQLPLPADIDIDKAFDSLSEELDIDMLSRAAKLAYAEGKTERVPPVAGAVDEILKRHGVELEGKKILILGKGRLVGEPVGMMLTRRGLPYQSVSKDSAPEEIESGLASADIIISGIGVPHFIKPEMVKKGVVIIDAGTSEEGGELKGDADPRCEEVASLFTPVPGGVGPITVACLFRNLYLQ